MKYVGEIVGLGKNTESEKWSAGGGYSLRGPAMSGMPERAHQPLREDFSNGVHPWMAVSVNICPFR